MLYCPDCGHHHRRHDGHPHPCLAVIYTDDDNGPGARRCPCQHQTHN